MATSLIRQDRYKRDEISQKLEQILVCAKIPMTGRILLKPNCTGIFHPKDARTTHPDVVASLIEILKSNGADVLIGESSSVGVDTNQAFKVTGIAKVARQYSVKLINFKQSKYVERKVKNGFLDTICLPYEALSADYIYSVAKLKTNYVTTVSLTIKNLKGLLADWQKKEFHYKGLSKSIVDLYSVVSEYTKVIGVVDGIVGSELYNPRKAGLLAVSNNPLACDSVCSRIMRVDPKYVGHIQPLYDCQIPQEFILKCPFNTKAPGIESMEKEFGIEIYIGDGCSSCIGGLYHSLLRIKQHQPDLLHGSKVKISVGKNADGKVIRYGTCSCVGTKSELDANGCPPTTQDLQNAIMVY